MVGNLDWLSSFLLYSNQKRTYYLNRTSYESVRRARGLLSNHLIKATINLDLFLFRVWGPERGDPYA